LLDLIRSFAPESASSGEIRDELQKLLNHLRVKRVSPKITNQGNMDTEAGLGVGAEQITAAERTGVKSANGEVTVTKTKPTDLS
ncbi:hypothetical protein ABTJ74_19945, partial [Acinetobacter baumannii]